VDEAGRAAEPPVIVAPPGLDIDPEVKAVDEVVDNKTVPSSQDDAVNGNGNGNGEAPRRREMGADIPFPADGIGKPKGSARDAAADSAASGPAADDGGSADGHSDDDRPDGAATGASSVLDSGRQKVRNAMAAFSTRSAKSDSSSPEDETQDLHPSPSRPAMTQGSIMAPPVSTASPAASVFTPAERRPSFTPSSSSPAASSAPATSSSPSSAAASPSAASPSSTAPSASAAPSSSSGRGGSGSGGQSLWREVRRPSPASSSAAPATGAAAGRPSDPSRPAGPGPTGPAGSPSPGSSYSSQSYAAPSTGPRPGSSAGPGAHAGSSGGQGLSAAAAAVGGAAAGLAGSVTSAFQGRNTRTKQRRRRPPAGVRRSPKRQAQLTLARVEPWSVMKFSFVVSVVAFIILFVAVAVLYLVLSALGVFTSLQHTVSSITSSQGSAGTDISSWFSASRILGYTGMLGALNIVLITAMSTIGAVIYNLIATTIGGVEVTLRETE